MAGPADPAGTLRRWRAPVVLLVGAALVLVLADRVKADVVPADPEIARLVITFDQPTDPETVPLADEASEWALSRHPPMLNGTVPIP